MVLGMTRLPDWAYALVVRVHTAQSSLRRAEAARESARQDRLLRWYFALDRARHGLGECGGAVNGCRFAPCYRVVMELIP